MKEKVIEKQNVKLNVHVSDWKEAVVKSGELLVKSGYITEKYIESIIESVKEMGPYIVLAPGLALAHARPDASVLKAGISFITLSEPVNFGCELDPVSIVITLAATDNESHLNKLQVLAELLSNAENMERLQKAAMEDVVTDMFNGYVIE